ncbi:MAG: O-antigen ligase family protein [Spirochaetes bacterium]|nr:O-antigen ligase family protein [Spirochaetota bacterium]
MIFFLITTILFLLAGFLFMKKYDLKQWLIYLIIFSSPLIVYRYNLPPGGFNLTFMRIFLMAGLLALLVTFVIKKDLLFQFDKKVWLLFGLFIFYFLYKIMNGLKTENSFYSIRQLFIIFSAGLVLFVIPYYINTEEKYKTAVKAFLASCIIPMLIGIYRLFMYYVVNKRVAIPFQQFIQYGPQSNNMTGMQGFGYGELYIARVMSTLGSSPYYGEYLVYMIAMMIPFILFKKGYLKWSGLSLAVINLLLLVNTYSRSSWLLLIISCLIYMVYLVIQKKTLVVIRYTLVALVSVTVLFFMTPAKYQEYLIRRSTDLFDNKTMSTMGHIQTRGKAIEFFKSSPLTGIGLGNFGVRLHQSPATSSSHAFLLTELAEGGLIGFLLLLTFLSLMVYSTIRVFLQTDKNSGLRLYLLGISVTLTLFFINNIIIYDTLFRDTSIIIMALCVSAINIAGIKGNDKTRSVHHHSVL